MSISSPRHHAYFNKRIMLHIRLEENEELGNAAMQRKLLCRAERLGGISYRLLHLLS